MTKIVTIAGSDSSGGAGLEADLKTFEEYGLYGMSAVTLIATMDPNNNWAHGVYPIDEPVLRAQMETIFKGVGVAAAKSGMLGTPYAVELTREYITNYKVKNYVLDPVMVCKGADEALNPALNEQVIKKLLPLALVVTPNLFEAGQIAGMKVESLADMERAAKIIIERGARSVFIKGASKLSADENKGMAVDIFYDGKTVARIETPLIDTKWTHGAGCTTAAAIASGLALGLDTIEAVKRAKQFIDASLNASFPLNQWVGPGNPSAWRAKKALFGQG